ncbi:MAG: nitroreductase family protein [Chloroflexi bacterium]|nr:nitroreductase family protein [Chloroflexota bacterium]
MPSHPLLECINKRRSIRKYTEEPVEYADILMLIESGIMAPSGSNIQPWKFIVVDDPQILKMIISFSPGVNGNPPCLLVLCSDQELANKKGGKLGSEYLALMDICMAAENIMLAATDNGLGTCAVKSFESSIVQRILNLPEHIHPELMISIGHSSKDVAAPRRRPLEEVVFHNVWKA